MFKGTSPCQTQKLGRMTCQIHVLSTRPIFQHAVYPNVMTGGQVQTCLFHFIIPIWCLKHVGPRHLSWKWNEYARASIRCLSFCIYNTVFGDSTWMVKFAMNHRGLGPRGWRIIPRVAGVLLVIPQRSAGDPNQQPTTDGSRYLKIYMIYILLDVRCEEFPERILLQNPPLCRIDGLWGWSLAVPWGLGRFRKSVDVVNRCRTTKWFDSKFDSLASVLNWASMIVSAPTPKSEYKYTGICRFLNVPCKFLARLLDSNLTLWLPWKS